MFTVETPRRYTVPYLCSTCGRAHELKTYHLDLDGVGDVVVSESVYERLREVDFAGMKVLGEVRDPEPIVLSLDGRSEAYRVVPYEGKVE
jgi:hypothetical protein